VTTTLPSCYRHPDRETGVRCQRCERPICPDCMIPAPVGVQCPDCVRRARQAVPAGRRLRLASGRLTLTGILVAVNVGVWVLGLVLAGPAAPQAVMAGSPLAGVAGLSGPRVAAGEWWRLFTAGFLHSGLLHLGLNMVGLAVLGPPVERALGRLRFAVLYLVGLAASSLGALLLSPRGLTVGASGAIFALMGALLMGQRAAGMDIRRSGILGLVIANLLFTALVPGISIGGHLGGLAGGLLAGALLFHRRLHPGLATLACLGLAAACTAGALWVAGHPPLG
jgi:membrane associated rhomboid family serine protease